VTGREWQPGDVARVTYSGVDQIALVRPRQEALGERLEFAYVSRGYDMVDDPDVSGSARPLVVIDPEDREQVEQLMRLILRLRCRCGFMLAADAKKCEWYRTRAEKAAELRSAEGSFEDLADALREFASPTPAKPDEPTGLGAVVEDAQGVLWVRVPVTDDDSVPWVSAPGGTCSPYRDIDAVKVVKDGYKPGEPSC